MKKKLALGIIFAGIACCCQAQFTRYVIKLRDKGFNQYSLTNPAQFLTQRALDRRARYNIAIDSLDLPVTARYIDSIRLSGDVNILNSSRWLNQVAIKTTDAAALIKINSFPFVLSVGAIAAKTIPGNEIPVDKKMDSTSNEPIPASPNGITNATGYYNYGSSNGQIKIHQGDFLHNHGFRGDGMQLAVLDAGFYHYQTLQTFDSIRLNNQVLGTWDFVANEESVNEDYAHGMQCLSTIAANIPGVFIGTAPKAKFYLYRTEDIASEYPIEEQNLAVGLERSDSLGVDLCSISLGYYDFDNAQFSYSYNDMNGNTSISARASDFAAKKGMLLVVALGNEGNNTWHYLITPSDADSVLSVGAVDSLGNIASFSSYGPSSDGQVKPSVAAVGSYAVVANTNNGLPSYGFGTSFACPNMAGVTTCLWQAFPEYSNMDIIDVLELSANNFTSPNNRIGYGIPDAKKAFVILQKRGYTQQVTVNDCNTNLRFSVKTDETMRIIIERKTSTDNNYVQLAALQNQVAYGLHNFSYDDDLGSVAAGTVQYRMKMMIAADTSYYLDSVSINLLQACNNVMENEIRILPNPVSDFLKVNIKRTTAAKVDIVVRNSAGQKVLQTGFQQPVGSRTEQLSMLRFSRAVYFVSVYIDGKKAVTKKIIKE